MSDYNPVLHAPEGFQPVIGRIEVARGDMVPGSCPIDANGGRERQIDIVIGELALIGFDGFVERIESLLPSTAESD